MKTVKYKGKLKEIKIGGYKSISSAHPVSVQLGDINILLGANGSGKSNVISFFKMLNFMTSGNFQLFVERAGTSQVFLHYGAKHTDVITGHLNFETETNIDRYKFELTHATPDRLIIKSEEVEWEEKGESKTLPLECDFKESALTKITDNKTIHIIREALAGCRVYQFHDSSNESPLRQSSPAGICRYLQTGGNNLASFLHYIKGNHCSNYNRIVSYINFIMPQFKDFYLEPNEKGYVSLKWVDIFPNDYVLLPEQFSDGTIRFIALATLLLQPEETIPGVIIIDEPELGLHPFAIGQLAEMIKEAAKHTQIIVATQSPGLIDEFEANQITVMEAKNGYSTANRLNEEELKYWLENYSLSECPHFKEWIDKLERLP